MRIGLGCVNLGSASRRSSERADARLVAEAIDHGVFVFDTADVYGSGASERVLGQAVARRRDEVTIASKGGYQFRPRSSWEQTARRTVKAVVGAIRSPSGPSGAGGGGGGVYAAQDFSPASLRRAVDGSLRRLRTDHIDVYQFHGPRQLLPDLIGELHDLVDAGKVVRFGVGAESVAAATEWAAVPGIEVVQLPFGVLDPEATRVVFPTARRHATEVWARGVLGGGVLRAAEEGRIGDHPKRSMIEELGRIARGSGRSIDELAVGFVRAYADDVSTMLIGVSSREHLLRNLDLMASPPLADDVLAALRSLVPATPGRDS